MFLFCIEDSPYSLLKGKCSYQYHIMFQDLVSGPVRLCPVHLSYVLQIIKEHPAFFVLLVSMCRCVKNVLKVVSVLIYTTSKMCCFVFSLGCVFPMPLLWSSSQFLIHAGIRAFPARLQWCSSDCFAGWPGSRRWHRVLFRPTGGAFLSFQSTQITVVI